MRTTKRASRVLGAAVSATVGDRRRAAAVLSVAALTFTASAAHADHNWNVTTGDYTVPTNWLQGTLPNGDNAFVNNGGTVTLVAGDTQPPNPNDLRLSDSGTLTNTYLQSGSTLALNGWFRMSDAAGTTSFAQVSGGTLMLNNGRLNVAEAGTGTFNQTGGTVNVSGGPTEIAGTDQGGSATTGVGTLNLTGGTYNTSGEVWSGEKGNGTLNVNTAGTLNLSNWLAIGRNAGVGVVNLGPGGTINKTGNGNITFAGTTNTLNQTGGNLNNPNSQTWVGESGNSVYNMSGGTANLGVVVIGRNGGETGTVNLTGGTFAVTQIGYNAGTGILNFNGGTLQANTNASGTALVSGLTTARIGAGGAIIDANGQSVAIVQNINSGTAVGTPDGGLSVVNSNPSGGQLNLAGTISYTGPTSVAPTVTLQVGNGSTAGIVNSGGALSGTGPINVVTGTLDLGSNANPYTGTITVSNGGAILIGTGGTTGSLIPSGTLSIQPGGGFGYDRSDNVTQTAPLPGGATLFVNAGPGTTTLGPSTGASTLNITSGVIYVPDATAFNTITSVFAAYPAALAVSAAGQTQSVLNLFTPTSGGVFALSADTSNSLDFGAANLPNVRLGAYPAGATVTYSGALSPYVLQNAGSAIVSATYVLGGGGGTLNVASALADAGIATGVDINAGSVTLTNPANAFTGAVSVQPMGTLILPTSANVGVLGGTGSQLVLRGGVLQYQANDPAPLDVTRRTTYLANAGSGNATVNTSNNAVTFAGPIGGVPVNASTPALTFAASFTKAGLGSLTDTSTVTATQLFVRQGSLTFDGASSGAVLNSYSSIGLQGGDAATLNLTNGAKLTGVADFNIGDTTGGLPGVDTGIVNLSDAANAGTTASVTTLYLAKAGLNADGTGGSVGVINQTGGTFNNSGNANIGVNGAGTVNLTGGAFNVNGTAFIGVNAPAVGAFNISGGTATFGAATAQNNNSQIGVNNGSTGVVNQTGGSVTFNNGFIAVGRFVGATGVYNLSGGSLTSTGGTGGAFVFIVGEQGTGTLNISGANTTLTTNGLGVAYSDGVTETGTVNQNGGTVTAAGLGVIYAQNDTGNASTSVLGTYNLNGGTLNALTVRQVAPANGAAVTSVFNFNGGTLGATAASTTFITGLTQANVLAGGANINTSTFAVTVPQSLIHGGTAPADGGLTVGGTGTLTLAGANTYTGLTTVNAGAGVILSGTLPATDSILDNGTFTFPGNASNTAGGVATRTKASVTVGSTGLFTIGTSALTANRTLLILSSLSDAGKVDVGNNDVIVHNGNIATLTAAAAAGYNVGSFNGATGIVSSAALSNTSRLTTVGVILNSTGTSTITGRFDLTPVTATDVLVKYTYFGDANLDGVVDGSDYGRIDAGFLSQSTASALTGWQNGDFNYDGKVDASDYTLIDNAFNLQSTTTIGLSGLTGGGLVASSAAEIAPASGTSAVPEPASIGLLAVAAGGLLARRRRA